MIQEIVSQEQTIADLKQAIDDLERPLMVAQTRTQRRGFRPNMEGSRDHPQCRSVEIGRGVYPGGPRPSEVACGPATARTGAQSGGTAAERWR